MRLTPVCSLLVNVLSVNLCGRLNHFFRVKVVLVEKVLVVNQHVLRVSKVVLDFFQLSVGAAGILRRIANHEVDIENQAVYLVLASNFHNLTRVDANQRVVLFQSFNESGITFVELIQVF